MSKIKTEKHRDNRRDIELPPNAKQDVPVEVEEQSGAEKLLMASKPYWSVIALGLLICILAWVIVSYLMQSSRESAAEPSRQLSDAMQQFYVSGNVDSLKQMRTDYPNEKATNWAMMIAGDFELNRGLSQFAGNREAAIKLIKRSKESFQSVIDSPSSAKTTMQERSSLYSLAYANEALGEFETAKTLYDRVLKEAPDSILAENAENGLERISDSDFGKLYDEFVSYTPAEEEAPGAVIPDKPNIDFPDIDVPKDSPETSDTPSTTGGDFKPENEMKVKDVAKPETGTNEAATDTESTETESATPAAGSESATESAVPEVKEPETLETEIKDAVDSIDGDVKESVKDVGEATEKVTEAAVDGVKDAVESVEEAVTEGADK